MSDFICKIADIEEVNRKWDYEISMHPNEKSWVIWKDQFIYNIKKGTRLCYYGILDGKIVTECTAVISIEDENMQNKAGLVSKNMAYLTAFRTIEEYQGKGYFSLLYKFMEEDLINRGFEFLSLGVEPCEVKNMKIYFNLGYENFIKTDHETYPAESENLEPQKVMVNYYSKKLK
jgi:GNAT superfamily N-acetyltransferase